MSKSLLAIPKGRLYEGISNLFEEIGIILPPADSRQYYYPDFQKDCSLYIAKPKAIPELMHAGIADFCLCGLDIMKNNEYYDAMDLLKHTGLNPIRICLCSRYKTLDELCSFKKPIVCATEFESIAAKEFTELMHPHYILNTAGSTEGYVEIGADCIIDVVDTGKSLEANGLYINKVLFNSDTCLFTHGALVDSMYPECVEKLYWHLTNKSIK